jgi:hypothetical protein
MDAAAPGGFSVETNAGDVRCTLRLAVTNLSDELY